jgi:hypothetical protein
MLVAHVFKQSTRNLTYCNVSVSFVHDDYRSDVEAAPGENANAARPVLVHRSH